LFEEHLKLRPAVEVYDMMLVPALAIAEKHWQLGELSESKHQFILQSLKEMINDKVEVKPDAPTDVQSVESTPRCVLCLPAHNDADEITASMLSQVLAPLGCQVEIASAAYQVDDLVELVARRIPEVVCISATPPAALLHARHLARRIRARFPQMHILVGLWDAPGDLSKARERIGCGATIVASLAAAQEKVASLIPPPLATPLKADAAA
jgi:methylmalonyl-CoA mutase cobalamin-binding subunit